MTHTVRTSSQFPYNSAFARAQITVSQAARVVKKTAA
jgi:hypothetical protein